MFARLKILLNFCALLILVDCSEFKILDKEQYPQTLHAFWEDTSLNSGREAVFLSATVKRIDHQLGLLSQRKSITND